MSTGRNRKMRIARTCQASWRSRGRPESRIVVGYRATPARSEQRSLPRKRSFDSQAAYLQQVGPRRLPVRDQPRARARRIVAAPLLRTRAPSPGRSAGRRAPCPRRLSASQGTRMKRIAAAASQSVGDALPEPIEPGCDLPVPLQLCAVGDLHAFEWRSCSECSRLRLRQPSAGISDGASASIVRLATHGVALRLHEHHFPAQRIRRHRRQHVIDQSRRRERARRERVDSARSEVRG